MEPAAVAWFVFFTRYPMQNAYLIYKDWVLINKINLIKIK
jgi:hypothetical protein